MKKILAVLMLVVTTCLLCGCIIRFQNSFEPMGTVDQIESVEIFYLHSSVYSYRLDTSSFESVAVLEQSDFNQMHDRLQNLAYNDLIILVVPTDSNYYLFDFVIKVQYNDGTFDLVSEMGAFAYDSNNKVTSDTCGWIDEEIWKQLIVDFVGQEQWDKYIVEE